MLSEKNRQAWQSFSLKEKKKKKPLVAQRPVFVTIHYKKALIVF